MEIKYVVCRFNDEGFAVPVAILPSVELANKFGFTVLGSDSGEGDFLVFSAVDIQLNGDSLNGDSSV